MAPLACRAGTLRSRRRLNTEIRWTVRRSHCRVARRGHRRWGRIAFVDDWHASTNLVGARLIPPAGVRDVPSCSFSPDMLLHSTTPFPRKPVDLWSGVLRTATYHRNGGGLRLSHPDSNAARRQLRATGPEAGRVTLLSKPWSTTLPPV